MGVDKETNRIQIKNKLQRQKIFAKLKHQKNKQRHKERQARAKEERENPELRDERLLKNVTQTIETKRVFDETINHEIEGGDDFSSYFETTKDPKVLITTNANAKKPAYKFADMLMDFLPNCTFVKRQREYTMKDMAQFCSNRGYTHLVVVNEDKKVVNGITFIYLPSGPTFYFSVSSFIEGKKIEGHGKATNHTPELILNNFSTRLGNTVGRLLQSLFPHKPEIQGRQAVTFHNQRDFIFFRRHRYIFRNEEKVGLQELGPQFTLRLRRIQKGIKEEVEWEHRPDMDRDKRKFYI
ncbi:hypothetical protein PACTADRAFT_51846 [Pachysolen tannophilus NRRL Y-2460]|uniref:Brix domain-containing protein n=1 Tax=Pachysolen tannophilus NRRL Y-2460 TaxID=669874 RepID=A0A1E4TNC4_PACTA|nr:hypothetical protein PACTADRAFT_51846 [Pachysolen tannophilus NRRL Y-2460]